MGVVNCIIAIPALSYLPNGVLVDGTVWHDVTVKWFVRDLCDEQTCGDDVTPLLGALVSCDIVSAGVACDNYLQRAFSRCSSSCGMFCCNNFCTLTCRSKPHDDYRSHVAIPRL